MSKKSEKKNRRQKNLNVDTVDENMTFISQDKIFDYLRMIMKRFSGYNFISVSPIQKHKDGKKSVDIFVHRNIPVQNNGQYRSDQDQYVRTLYVENDDFPGMIMDRQKNYAFGNPFKKHDTTSDVQVPNLGEDKVEFESEDEEVQPL